MRKNQPKLEKHRVTTGPIASDSSYGMQGAFIYPSPQFGPLQIISSIGDGWEHVSVTYHKKRAIPEWDVMSFVKDLFWEPEETVIQIHPPKSQYINTHPFVLHLWRPTKTTIPLPPTYMIGLKGVELSL